MAESLITKLITLARSIDLQRFFRERCAQFRKYSGSESVDASQPTAKKYANIGCGLTWHADWDNYDLVPGEAHIRKMNIVRDWSIPDGTYDAIYSSHVLEHLPRNMVKPFLMNCFNSLRSGGVLRIVVPDLEGICREYIKQIDAVRVGDETAARRHQWMTLELLDQVVRNRSGGAMAKLWASGNLPEEGFIVERVGDESAKWMQELRKTRGEGVSSVPSYEDIFEQLPQVRPKSALRFREGGEVHQWMYDEVSLSSLLCSIGFQLIVRCGAAESSISGFASYNLDTNEYGRVRKPDSLFIECVRPF